MNAWEVELLHLERFWRRVGDGADRLEMLQRFAEVKVERPRKWDRLKVREYEQGLTAESCWCCYSRDRRTYWHHVIQVQHGGSNNPHNLVSLCNDCHRRVHPWLAESTTLERRSGWASMFDIVTAGLDMLERALGRKQGRA
jgi:hypothetical protein